MTDTVDGRDDARPNTDPITIASLIDLAAAIPADAVLIAARNLLTAAADDGGREGAAVRLRRLGVVVVLLMRAEPDLIDVLYAKEARP